MARHAYRANEGRLAGPFGRGESDASRIRAAIEADARRPSMLSGDGTTPDLFHDVSSDVRAEMARIVRAYEHAQDALPPIVELLLGARSDDAQRDAVARAVMANDKLHAQWQRAYHQLRSEEPALDT